MQIFDNLQGREPLQVIKDNPEVKCLYRRWGNVTECLCYGVRARAKNIYVARVSMQRKSAVKMFFHKLWFFIQTSLSDTLVKGNCCLTSSPPWKLNKLMSLLHFQLNRYVLYHQIFKKSVISREDSEPLLYTCDI